ncbi:MAG: hypothetical protein IT371_16795 [Deltaproteobacteria bacterium]|nr:hypothetical protein [Deltaproteobacteria bacterium]
MPKSRRHPVAAPHRLAPSHRPSPSPRSRALVLLPVCALLLSSGPARADDRDAVAARLAAQRSVIEQQALTVDPTLSPPAGTKPIAFYRTATGELVIAKHGSPAEMMAEVVSAELRSRAGLPSVPAALRSLYVPALSKVVEVVVKPVIPFQTKTGGKPRTLGRDVRTWTPSQRNEILRSIVADWWLWNSDSHVGQYLLWSGAGTQEEGLPANVDFDRAFSPGDSRYHKGQPDRLTRFRRYLGLSAGPQNAVFDAYVHGRVELDLELLLDEVARVERVPRQTFSRLVRRYAQRAFPAGPARQRFVAAALARRDHLRADVEGLIADLQKERSSPARRWLNLPRDLLQRVLLRALDSRVRTWVERISRNGVARLELLRAR